MAKQFMANTGEGDSGERLRAFLAAQLETKDKDALKFMLGCELGRWFFVRLLARTGYQAKIFTGNATTFYNEGRRALGVELYESVVHALGLEGVEMRQLAEREFIEMQLAAEALFKEQGDF
jgi:protein-disulfide isomerase-like protein with CxxC motif